MVSLMLRQASSGGFAKLYWQDWPWAEGQMSAGDDEMIDVKNPLGGCCSSFKVTGGKGADKIDQQGSKDDRKIPHSAYVRISQSENAIVPGKMLRGQNGRMCRVVAPGHDFNTVSQHPNATTLAAHLGGGDGGEIISTTYNDK